MEEHMDLFCTACNVRTTACGLEDIGTTCQLCEAGMLDLPRAAVYAYADRRGQQRITVVALRKSAPDQPPSETDLPLDNGTKLVARLLELGFAPAGNAAHARAYVRVEPFVLTISDLTELAAELQELV
jgi:hypothetical protein